MSMGRVRVALVVSGVLAIVGCGGHHGGGGEAPLTVVSSAPAAAADGVPTDAFVEITFNEVLDAAQVSNASVAVSVGASPVPGDVVVVAGGKGLRFYPSAPFQHLATVDISVPAGLKAQGGATLATAYTAQFRTIARGIYFGFTRVEGLVGSTSGLAAFLQKDDGSLVQLDGGQYSVANPAVATVATNGGNQLTVHLVGEGITKLTATGPGQVTGTLPLAAALTTGDGTAFMVSSALLNGASHHEWDVNCDGTLINGGATEVNGASIMTVDPDNTAVPFVCPATIAGVAFQAPTSVIDDLSQETSLQFVNTGNSSCHLLPNGESAMFQDVQMPNTATALTLTWNERIRLQDADALTTKSLVVTVQNLTDNLAPVVVSTSAATQADFDNNAFAPQTVDLLPLNVLGKKIRLMFTARGGGYDRTFSNNGDGVHLDDISILDQAATEYVMNGGCEGLT
ncbi:MAG TPA: Ig-like domain-containing protein, partial [bacterium]|nr:Ig-like domain-containing protein [bacterium]